MADKKPPKGILKHSSSLDHPHHAGHKEMKWDEMNILATHHPPDKTYGHMKIDEPPTPYSKCSDLDDDEEEGEPSRRRGSWSGPGPVSASDLASKLEQTKHLKEPELVVELEENDSEEDELTEEESAKKRAFELKRKLHYNEFQAVQLAKKLLAEEEEEDEEEEEEKKEEEKASSSSSGKDNKGKKTSNKNNHTPGKHPEAAAEAGAAAADNTEDIADVAMASDARADRREEPIEVETEI